MNIFVGEDKDFKFFSEVTWEPVQRNQYGGIWSLVLDLVSTRAAAFWINWRVFKMLLGETENKESQ